MIDRSLLTRATSNDSSPTPGYLYSEIARMTYLSHEECNQVATYLLKRLQKRSGVVKLKVLNVVKHVCLKGPNGFRRVVQLHIENVKECLSFTGPPDPLCGDEIYVLVRRAAKEVLEAVYSDKSSGATASPVFESRIRGFGSTRVEDHALSEGGYIRSITSGTNGTVGIGNGGLVTARKSWLKNASDSIKSAASAVEAKVKNVRQTKGDTQDNYVGGRDGFGNTSTFNGCVSNRGPTPYWTTNGQGGGTSQLQQQPGNCIGMEENAVAWSSANSHHVATSPTSLRADSSDEYLDNAVAAVCAPGGTRAVPSKVQLDAFMVKTAFLDQLKVQDALLKLAESSEDDWRVQSKALSVLTFLVDGEKRMQREKLTPDDDGRENCNKIESCLVRICEHSNAPVREKCAELLRILGRNVPVSKGNAQHEGGAATASVPVGPSLTPDLLGDFEEMTTLPTVLQDSLDHVQQPEDYINLFDNMMMKELATVSDQPTSSSTSSFPFMSVNPVVDTFQGKTTAAATTPFSSSGPNAQSSSGLDCSDCSSAANGNPVDLISGQPISSSPNIASTTLDGLDPFHDRSATSSLVLMEIPTQAQIQTEMLLTPKSELGFTEAAAQSSSVPANVGMMQHSSVAMHQHRLQYVNNSIGMMQSASIVQQRQMFMAMIQQQNQYQSMVMQQRKMQKKEMHKYRGTGFSTPVVGAQNSPPIELEHDEFSFVRDAMKLAGK